MDNNTGLRRSPRLQESGYYRGKEERLYKPSKKQLRHKESASDPAGPHCPIEAPVSAPESVALQEPRARENVTCSQTAVSSGNIKKCFWILLMLSIAGIVGMCCSDMEWGVSMKHETLPNFAKYADGAYVHRTRSSRTYNPGGLFEFLKSRLSPTFLRVIHPMSPLFPGFCWPFAGAQGHIHIELSETVYIDHISLGHIAKSQFSTGEENSAPKVFSVYGMKTPDGDQIFLGRFQYNSNGAVFQTFRTLEHKDAFRHVRINVESNDGNKDYTCLYNIRVHGQPAQPEETAVSPPH